MDAGAVGLSVAKTAEAEIFGAAGFGDIFVAYPVVGTDKGRRLLALSERCRLSVGVDSVGRFGAWSWVIVKDQYVDQVDISGVRGVPVVGVYTACTDQ